MLGNRYLFPENEGLSPKGNMKNNVKTTNETVVPAYISDQVRRPNDLISNYFKICRQLSLRMLHFILFSVKYLYALITFSRI
ncbi:hypothetical protein C0J52_17448 [Blattella germanica]|nr:hypothetical protein C0J52_17448 [Blattella germanica]